MLNGCGWRGLEPEQRRGQKPLHLHAQVITECVVSINIHPNKSVILFHSLSASEHGLSITPGDHQESGASLYPTTQDTGRRLPVATTAPSINVLNHHPLYRNPPRHQAPLGPHSHPNYFEDSGGSSSRPGSQPTFSTSLDSSDKRASDESAESTNMQTTLVMQASASHANTPVPATSAVLKDPERAAIIPSAATAARENKDVRPDEEETTTSTITTTTIITTMRSPGETAVLLPVCLPPSPILRYYFYSRNSNSKLGSAVQNDT